MIRTLIITLLMSISTCGWAQANGYAQREDGSEKEVIELLMQNQIDEVKRVKESVDQSLRNQDYKIDNTEKQVVSRIDFFDTLLGILALIIGIIGLFVIFKLNSIREDYKEAKDELKDRLEVWNLRIETEIEKMQISMNKELDMLKNQVQKKFERCDLLILSEIGKMQTSVNKEVNTLKTETQKSLSLLEQETREAIAQSLEEIEANKTKAEEDAQEANKKREEAEESAKKAQKDADRVSQLVAEITKDKDSANNTELQKEVATVVEEDINTKTEEELTAKDWLLKAYDARHKDKYEEACAYYEKSLAINPQQDGAYNNWGASLAYLALKNNDESLYQKACEKYEKAIEIKPNYETAFYNWGNTLYRRALLNNNDKTLLEEACSKYEKASAINPNDAVIFYNWGLALTMLAQKERNLSKREEEIATLYKKAEKLGDQKAAYNLACLYSLLKSRKSFYWLEQFFERADEYTIKSNITTRQQFEEEDDFKHIRSNPQFYEILDRYLPKN